MRDDYQTKEWFDLQDRVLEDSNWTCADCGWHAVVAHHKSYVDGILCTPHYLVALCNQCHRVRHGLVQSRRSMMAELEL
jgi:ribosomal protein S27AE